MSAELVTNKNANPGLKVAYSNGGMVICVNNTFNLDLGITSRVILGGWNRFLACTSTLVQIGTRMEVLLTNSISVVEGDAWNYCGTNQSTADVDQKYGVYRYLICGGVHIDEKNSRLNEQQQAKLIITGTILIYAATIAVSLAGIASPLFDNGSSNNQENSNKSGDDNESDLSLNPEGIPSAILTGLWVIFTFISQFIMAKKLADNLKTMNAVSNLSLAANGLTSAVFSDPLRQPKLVVANRPENERHADHYGKLPHGRVAYYEGGQLKYRNASLPEMKDSGSSPAAVFNMLPGMPDPLLLDSYDSKDSPYHNWENLKEGKYPDHDKKPVITLSSQLEPHKKTSSSLDILPDSVMLASRVGAMEGDFQAGITKWQSSASIALDSSADKSQIMMESTNNMRHGGCVIMNNEITAISRNLGKAIELSFIGKEASGSDGSASAVSSSNNVNDSLLHLSAGRASMTTGDGNTGIYVLDKSVEIVSDGKIVASFSATTGAMIMGKKVGNKSSTEGDVLEIKNVVQLETVKARMSKCDDINRLLTDKIRDMKFRLDQIESHKERTGGFSGTVWDDGKKNWNPFSGYTEDDGTKYGATKIATFKGGWKNILKGLWPLPWHPW
jgi:hypothetical protein